MKLIEIDKKRYRQHLNQIIVGFIACFLIISLILGQFFIMLFAAQDGSGDNFWLNFSGVALALVLSLGIINKYKTHHFMSEVFYVWQLKQQINFIYRKLKTVKSKAFSDVDIDALIILSFYYKACRQLYNLDDNTITLSSLAREEDTLLEFIRANNLSINSEDYQQQFIKDV
ncbi:DUF3087 family protein [Thalassotalea psychrophila]|uniref:DUF3087 family protein n=1 Tax=Thalassotalea psychrophila TaxID=3065647 RepID=A0ABY9TPB0_9GAMM|nr:DUF3087 family protein [Colwelliaceae bacterium SQ149]